MRSLDARRAGASLVLAFGLALAGPLPGADLPPASDGPTFHVRIRDARAAGAVRRALHGAFRRLGEHRCLQVLSEFQDASSRTLQENLEALGHDGQSYLGLVFFYDGSDQRACSRSKNLAFTSPGSRVIWICSDRFRQQTEGNPALGEAIVIHEVLHSLGLGENPPASADITARVRSRCRR